MNYKFEISLPDSTEFRAELAIKGEQTFLQLHDKIIEILGCADAQITSFYKLDKMGERVKEIALMDMAMGEEDSDILVMEETKIEDVINASCIELDYVYDFFNEKYLKVEYSGEYIGDSADILPLTLSIIGTPPAIDENDWEIGESILDDEEGYDDSFMKEFSDFSDLDDDEYKDEYGDDDEFGGGYGGRHENIDDYLDRL